MSFDLDDPLGDLLSDGSNDSFFGSVNKKPVKSKIEKPSIPPEKPKPESAKPTVSRQNKMENLFGIDLMNETQLNESIVKPVETKVNTPMKKPVKVPTPRSQTPIKKDEIDDDDDLGFDPRKLKATKTAYILDDLLGVKNYENPTKPVIHNLNTRSADGRKNLSRQSTTQSSDFDDVKDNPSPSLRKIGRAKTQIMNDPLGLFGGSSIDEEPKKEVLRNEAKKTPEWLKPSENEKKTNTNELLSPLQKVIEPKKPIDEPKPFDDVVGHKLSSPSVSLIQPTQLRQQEQELSNLQKKQRELTLNQEEKFHDSLQVHLNKQTELHEQEVDLLETSYKSQLVILEDRLANTERMLKNEIEHVENFHLKKEENMTTEKSLQEEDFKRKMQECVEDYEKAIESLKAKHTEDLKEIKEEHREMINNIRQSKLLEFSVVQENSTYLQTLQAASANLETATDDISTLRDNLKEKIESLHLEKEIQLKIREKRCEDLKTTLERQREVAENEKIRLLELIQALESQASLQTQTTAEHDWTVRQQIASLEAERLAFQREKEFFRDRMKSDEKRIEELKLNNAADKERYMKEISEDRLEVLAEKARLEVSIRLQKHTDVNKSRYEIDAAVKVAEEATHQADIERERLLQGQKQIEKQRRKLIDQENNLRTKEAELEFAMHSAKAREKSAEMAMKNIKTSEKNIFTKFQVLQKHANEIAERESKISSEKLEISKERMQLQALKQKLNESKCSLCKIGETSLDQVKNSGKPDQMDEFFNYDFNRSMEKFAAQDDTAGEINLDAVPNITDVSDNLLDPDLVMLKFDIINSLKNRDNSSFTEYDF